MTDARHRHFSRPILAAFAFAFVATLSFLLTRGTPGAKAVNLGNFRPGNIVSDYTMGNHNTMSRDDIQNFLRSKVSCNDYDLRKENAGGYNWEWIDRWDGATGVHYNYRIHFRYWRNGGWYYTSADYHVEDGHYVCIVDERFNGQSAADIIYEISRNYRINPQVLLVLLQKEQGLITDQLPNAGQYRSATGYGCPDTDVCDSQYYGFKNQLENAAALFRYILDHGSSYKPVGNNYIQYNPDSGCGGGTVNIENRATAALYQYTPYQPNQAALNAGYGTGDYCSAYGNRNFYLYFSDWFGDPVTGTSQRELVGGVPQTLPDGNYQISSKADSGLVFDIKDGVSSNTATGKLIGYSQNPGFTPNQVFRIIYDQSTGYYDITNPTTGLRIDVANASTEDNAEILLWKGHDGCNQKWTIEKDPDGRMLFRSVCSGKVLTFKDSNASSLNSVVLYEDSGSPYQRWYAKPLPAEGINSDASYQIVSQSSNNHTIDISGGVSSQSTSGKIILYDRRASNTSNQSFRFTYDDTSGYYYITNPTSNLRLDVDGAHTSNDTRVLLWKGHDGCNQKWLIERGSGTEYRIASACSGKILSIQDNNTSNLQPIVIHQDDRQSTQRWTLTTPPNQVSDIDTNREYQITPKPNDEAYTIDIYGGVTPFTKSGLATIYTRRASNTSNQSFRFTYDDTSGYYYITNPTSNLRLDVDGAHTSNDTRVLLWKGHDGCNQKWAAYKDSEGYYTFISVCSNMALSIHNDSLSNGTQIVIFDDNSKDTEKWKLSPIQ